MGPRRAHSSCELNLSAACCSDELAGSSHGVAGSAGCCGGLRWWCCRRWPSAIAMALASRLAGVGCWRFRRCSRAKKSSSASGSYCSEAEPACRTKSSCECSADATVSRTPPDPDHTPAAQHMLPHAPTALFPSSVACMRALHRAPVVPFHCCTLLKPRVVEIDRFEQCSHFPARAVNRPRGALDYPPECTSSSAIRGSASRGQ